MPADLQAIADQLEIDALLSKYAFHLDDRDWDAFKALFAPSAHMDYSAQGGPAGERDEIVAWLTETVSNFPMSQHVIANRLIEVEGDEATARSYLYNPMGLPDGRTTFLGTGYRDRFTRTDDGWRFSERVIGEVLWTEGW
jgi:3-phenylpropionate/cinnamic acid dioxygenase small subunit